MKKIFYWMIGGAILTTVAFFIPEQSGSMWTSVIASVAVVMAYLVVFLAVWLRRLNIASKQKAIAVTCTILLVFSVASAVISYEGSVRQRVTLENIRSQIEGGLLYTFVHEPLIKLLAEMDMENGNEVNVGRQFESRYDSLITENSVFEYGNRNDDQTLFLYVAKSNADSVVLVGESTYLNSKGSEFNNFSGAKGRHQVRGILTSKGVDYERQN